MVMLEKLITLDNSDFDRTEAFYFIEDNYLTIVNQYFIRAFHLAIDEASEMLQAGKVDFE